MVTEVEYNAWLADPSALRTVLVEVGVLSGGVETTRYISTKPYVTYPDDSPANTMYLPIVEEGITFTEQLNLSGNSGTLNSGTINISNYNGAYDSWLNDVFDNRSIKAFVGDARWNRSDFRMIFNGTVATIGVSSRDSLSLTMTDKLQRLNNPVSDQVLGGTTANQGNLIPLCFGECHNITPLLIDPVTLKYQVHNGPVESIFEVRDNGLPISVTVDNSTGTFTLNQPLVGEITCSVQGDKFNGVYATTISSIIQRIVTGYGVATSRFTLQDLDAVNLAAFDAAHPQQVGVFCPNGDNILTVINSLANSVGAQVVMSRQGLLRIIQVDVNTPDVPRIVDGTLFQEKSLYISQRPLVSGSVLLGFCKNYTVQSNLITGTGLQPIARDLFMKEWLQTTQTDPTVSINYKLNVSPSQIDTLLLARVDAEPEAIRRLNLWKIPRSVFKFTAFSPLLNIELGSGITLYNYRYGLSQGKTGMVVSVSPDYQTGFVDIEVLI